jgi:hypothetical protein
MLSGELESKSKEANALDSKVKNLKETVSSKTKQVRYFNFFFFRTFKFA